MLFNAHRKVMKPLVGYTSGYASLYAVVVAIDPLVFRSADAKVVAVILVIVAEAPMMDAGDCMMRPPCMVLEPVTTRPLNDELPPAITLPNVPTDVQLTVVQLTVANVPPAAHPMEFAVTLPALVALKLSLIHI